MKQNRSELRCPLDAPNDVNTAYLHSYADVDILVFRGQTYLSNRAWGAQRQHMLLSDLKSFKDAACAYVCVIVDVDVQETVTIKNMIARVSARVRRLEKKRRGG